MPLFHTLRRWFFGELATARAWDERAGVLAAPAGLRSPVPPLPTVTSLHRVLDGPLSDAEAMAALHKSPGFLAILDADNRVIWSAGLGVVPRARHITDALDQVRRTLGPVEFQTAIDHVTHNVMAYPWFDSERRRHTVLYGTPWFPGEKRPEADDERIASIAASACEAAALLGERPDGLCASCERRGVCWLHDRREAATTAG